MSLSSVSVRPFTVADVPQLLALMKGLAQFEGYIDSFCVTEQDIEERGLGERPEFEALVATDEGGAELLGMTVLYTIPFTYDLKPTLVIKELFVSDTARGRGVGSALFSAIKRRAVDLGCPRIEWSVLNGNQPAMDFYRQQGAVPDPVWQGWVFQAGD